MAIVPLIMATTINFPAAAGAPAVEVDQEPLTEVPRTEAGGEDYEVTLDTGVEVIGYGLKISALTVTATPETDLTQDPAQPDAGPAGD
jgi:hypothetical protein